MERIATVMTVGIGMTVTTGDMTAERIADTTGVEAMDTMDTTGKIEAGRSFCANKNGDATVSVGCIADGWVRPV